MSVRRMYSWEVLEILPLLHKFNEESGYGYPVSDDKMVGWILNSVLSRKMVVFVQIANTRIVGVLGGHIAPYTGSETERASEAFFYIEPEFRGGLAAVRMMKGFIGWACERGVDRCQMTALSSTDTEGKVRKFYESLGLKLVEQAFEIRKT